MRRITKVISTTPQAHTIDNKEFKQVKDITIRVKANNPSEFNQMVLDEEYLKECKQSEQIRKCILYLNDSELSLCNMMNPNE